MLVGSLLSCKKPHLHLQSGWQVPLYSKAMEGLWVGRSLCVNAIGRGDVSSSHGLALRFHAASRRLKRMQGVRVLVRILHPWKRPSARFLADPFLIVIVSRSLQVTRNGRSLHVTPGSVGTRGWKGGTCKSSSLGTRRRGAALAQGAPALAALLPSALRDGAASLSPRSPLIWDSPSSKAGCSNEPSDSFLKPQQPAVRC